ncbi:AAA domain-containing protein [Synechococcus sp. BIOS-E4-1]|uniref:AAA family ATPase n=1 Tax=Synechococcus sp. BIOS-E4-1 TaxID=1400864 RepID=UPI001648733B|nr:AAA family ATPase [Synechococcus sp. BIOS-E4-1]QNI53609.1 AAA domain-containing protein [Synechococcus sp. BIOS-E4-1]
MSELKPDLNAAKTFLDLLGKNGDARFRAFPHKHTPPEIKRQLRARKINGDRSSDRVLKAQNDGLGIYLVINRGGDDKASITECIAYFAEFDGTAEADQLQRVNDSGLPEPSIINRTGGGSLHFYWLLDTPIANKALWQSDMKRLAGYLGSDKSVNDPSRVMRLPGSLYMGPDQQPIALVETIHVGDGRYTREDIINALPADPTPLLEQPSPQPASDRTAERALDQLYRIPSRTPGSNTRNAYLRLLWGLAHILGPDRAGAAMAVHSPAWAAEEDLVEKAREANGAITDGTFFEVAKNDFNVTDSTADQTSARNGKSSQQSSHVDDDEPLEELIARKVGELLDLRLLTQDTWAKEMALIAELGWRGLKRHDIEERMYAALANRWKLAISQSHNKKRRGRSPNQTREGEQQQMLVHGFLPWKRDAVLFGAGGVGKTTAAVRIAWSAITGEPLLDFEIPGDITGKVLFIGSDGGTGAYDMWQNAAEDLGIANDPRWINGCTHWGADEHDGIGAWSVTPAGLQELKTELEENNYALVIIDSWKAVLSLAGVDFGIGPVDTIVRLIQALIAKHCSGLYLHHPSGNTKGKGISGAGGNQNINQIPYAVHELRVEPVSDDRAKCVRWIAHKLRGYVSREFLYRLAPDGFQIVEGELVRNCRDDILITVSDLEQMGTATTSYAIHNLLSTRNESTISNNLTKLRQDGFLKKTGSSWHLTAKGKRTVTELTKTHV